MGDMKDKSIHFTAQKLTEELQRQLTYKQFYSDVQRITSSPIVQKHNFKETLLQALKDAGIETELRNTVFHWMRSHNHHENNVHGYAIKEPLAYLRKSQVQWEKRIYKSLNSMSTELVIPLARFRLASDRDEMSEKWAELSTYDIDLSQYRPVYAPKDFLEVILSIRSPNFQNIMEISWDISHLPLHVKTLPELRSLYSELFRGEALIGVNPYVVGPQPLLPTLEAERTSLGEKVINLNHAPMAQEFLKRGCPRCLRGKMWAQVLGSNIKQMDVDYFNKLKQLVLQYDLLVDKLIIKDVQLTASNDDQYFVFEDILYQVMLCFSRDTEVLSVSIHSSGNPLQAILKNRVHTVGNTVLFPPSGVLPFHGFTMYATPFCYLCNDPVALYFLFRAFYLRYWFRLHEVSSHPQSILGLCLLFQRLLERNEPQLWIHFKLIGIHPLRIVFKWLMRGFSGHLPPEQLLFLWDLILAYDSLEIVPLLAIGILSIRKYSLLQVNNQATIESILADLSSISVMPILQGLLIRDDIPPIPSASPN